MMMTVWFVRYHEGETIRHGSTEDRDQSALPSRRVRVAVGTFFNETKKRKKELKSLEKIETKIKTEGFRPFTQKNGIDGEYCVKKFAPSFFDCHRFSNANVSEFFFYFFHTFFFSFSLFCVRAAFAWHYCGLTRPFISFLSFFFFNVYFNFVFTQSPRSRARSTARNERTEIAAIVVKATAVLFLFFLIKLYSVFSYILIVVAVSR